MGTALLRLFCLYIVYFVNNSHAVTPVIQNTNGNANLNELQSGDICVYPLMITPAAFSCQQTSSFTQFALQKRVGDPEYCVYYLHLQTLTPPSYTVTFSCEDDVGNNDTGTVKIDILPDNPPVFTGGVSVVKNVDASTTGLNDVMFSVTATDTNGDPLTYNLDPTSTEFYIDPSTGVVKAKIDFNTYTGPATLTFNAQVTDGHSGKVDQAVTLNIQNINTAPQITNLPPPLDVSESLPAGSPIYTCTHDETGPLTTTLTVDPLTEQAVFALNAATCEISIAAGQSLDFERESAITLKLRLDDGVYSQEFPITLNVLNANDPPTFASNSYTTETEECLVPIDPLLQPNFVVNDIDTGDFVTYSLGPGPFDSFFNIDPVSGEITCLQELDFDGGVTTATVTVVATDQGGETATTMLTVNVVDNNDNDPEFGAGQEFYVSPKVPPGYLGDVVATDKDTGPNADLTYSLKSDPSGKFLVNPDGKVYLQTAVTEAERGTIFTVVATATDDGTPKKSADTTITILFNPPPVITNLPNVAYISEDLDSMKDIFKITVNETDPYSCVAKDVQPTAAFIVDQKGGTGDWFVFYDGLTPLSYATTPTYTVDVECKDSNDGTSSVGRLTVNVGQNQPPFIDCSSPVVPVDASTTVANTDVYQIIATDSEQLTYGATFQSSTGTFSVDSSTGNIKSQKEMLRETQSQYVAVVTASDAFNSVSCTITFTMTNTNVAPIFSDLPKSDAVDEDLAAGSTITVITIADPQECDPMTFTWDVDPQAERNKFDATLNNNEVTISVGPGQVLDYETTQDYVFYLRANDGCLDSQLYPYYLSINDINEKPEFTNGDTYTVYFDEIGSPSSPLNCGGFDPDVGENHQLILEGAHKDKFDLADVSKCYLRPVLEMDRDAGFPQTFQLTMKMIDKGMLSATATINVVVREINDNDPICDQPAQTFGDIFNGDTIGREVGRVTATDDDLAGSVNEQLTYSLTTPSSPTSVIDLASDGSFHLVGDPEAQGLQPGVLLEYTVKVTDGGTPSRSAECKVNVQYIYTTTPPPPPTTQPPSPMPTTATSNNANTGNTATLSPVDEALSNPVILGLIAALSALVALAGIIGLAYCCLKHGCCKSKTGSFNTNNSRYDYRQNNASRLQSRGESSDKRGSRQPSPKSNQVANSNNSKTTTTDIYTVNEVQPNVHDGPTTLKYL